MTGRRVPPQGDPRLWFWDHKIPIFPVHPRAKAPAVPSWDDFRCERERVSSFTDYAVPLGAYGVADSDSPESETWVAAHLPDTPFKVRTARGVHRYYRLLEHAPNFFHRGGLSIEFRNRGQYVIGPGSTHATGHVYTADPWSWDEQDIPFFPVSEFLWDDRPVSERGSAIGSGETYKVPEVIKAGERHDQMYRMVRSMKMRGVPLDAALRACLVENQMHCRPPLSRRTVETHLRRVYNQPMRPGFHVRPSTPFGALCSLLDAGFSREACILAAQGIDPKFDPENPPTDLSPPEPSEVHVDVDRHGRRFEDITWYDHTGARVEVPRELAFVGANGEWSFKRKKEASR